MRVRVLLRQADGSRIAVPGLHGVDGWRRRSAGGPRRANGMVRDARERARVIFRRHLIGWLRANPGRKEYGVPPIGDRRMQAAASSPATIREVTPDDRSSPGRVARPAQPTGLARVRPQISAIRTAPSFEFAAGAEAALASTEAAPLTCPEAPAKLLCRRYSRSAGHKREGADENDGNDADRAKRRVTFCLHLAGARLHRNLPEAFLAGSASAMGRRTIIFRL